MITGWLACEDCPDCGGPLLETSTDLHHVNLECPGCGYRTTVLNSDPSDEETE